MLLLESSSDLSLQGNEGNEGNHGNHGIRIRVDRQVEEMGEERWREGIQLVLYRAPRGDK